MGGWWEWWPFYSMSSAGLLGVSITMIHSKNVSSALSFSINLLFTHATVTEGGVLTHKRAVGETSLTGKADRRSAQA